MHEGDAVPPTPEARNVVDQFGPHGAQVRQRRIDVRHLDGDVMQALAAPLQKPPHRAVGGQRGEHLQEGTTQGNHRLFDPLFRHRLPAQRLDPEESRQRAQRGLEVPHRNGGVMEVDGKHRGESSDPGPPLPLARDDDQNPQMFDDLLAANARYRTEFHDPGIPGTAAKGLAVLTCIDSRIAPLAMLGLAPGDAKIIRNAGARVTGDALRSLVLAVNLLGVTRVCVVQHTDCAVAGTTDSELRDRVEQATGVDAAGWEFLATTDQMATLRQDIAAIVACPLIPEHVAVGGFVFDVHRGALIPVPAA